MKQCWRGLAVVVTVLIAVGLGVGPAQGAALNLHRGSKGTQVKTLEVRLYTLHLLARSQVDRRFKPATARAVRKFQRQQDQRVTGRVNGRTWSLIAAEVNRRANPPKPRAAAAPPAPIPAPTIVGHRGAVVAGIPENTMASMRYASDKADVLEFDLRLTLDDQFVLMHDGDLRRMTNCTQNVNDVTLAYIQQSCPTKVGNETVPTFADVAAYAHSVSKAIAPEIKVQLSDADLEKFVTVLRDNGLVGDTAVQSFDPAIFPRLRALESSLQLVYLTVSSTTPAAVKATGATIAGPSIPDLTAARVAAFRAAGLKVWAWTAATTAQLQALWDMRVNGVFTNIPGDARTMYHPG